MQRQQREGSVGLAPSGFNELRSLNPEGASLCDLASYPRGSRLTRQIAHHDKNVDVLYRNRGEHISWNSRQSSDMDDVQMNSGYSEIISRGRSAVAMSA